jgi:hypothetical protein
MPTPGECLKPVFVPHGLFMVAVDPDGTIVESERPLVRDQRLG